MRTTSRTQSKKKSKTSLCKSHQQIADLEKLMSGIKDLQKKVSHMPIYLQLTKSNHTPKRKQKFSTSKSKYIQSNPTKRQQRENNVVKTIRKSDSIFKYDKAMISNDSKTFDLNLKKRQPMTGPHKDSSYFQSGKDPDLMNNYVSLQLQNLKLEKQNLELEKRLIQQSLKMERREKQLLKNRLKRMKTQTNHEYSHKITNKPVKTPVVSSFNVSPIKVKNLDLFSHNEDQLRKRGCDKQQQIKPVILKDPKHQNSMDSLLLSDQNEPSSPFNKNKSCESKLEEQFWTLMGEAQHQGQGPIREALGDIANKLKEVRGK